MKQIATNGSIMVMAVGVVSAGQENRWMVWIGKYAARIDMHA